MPDPYFFEGLTPNEQEALARRLERKNFRPGETLLREGDAAGDLYVIISGNADIVMTGPDGRETYINRVGPGTTLGEMSLLTGRPVSATVRATSDLSVLVLTREDFNRGAVEYPQLYKNLTNILSERLAQTNRRALHDNSHNVTLLLDEGAPPLLGYALACSLAWHTSASTLLLVVTDRDSPELRAFTGSARGDPLPIPYEEDVRGFGAASLPGTAEAAKVVIAEPKGRFGAETLARTVDDLCTTYTNVLVQLPGGQKPIDGLASRVIRLTGQAHGATTGDSDPICTISGWAGDSAARKAPRGGVLYVPSLQREDEHGLRQGRLGLDSEAGQALGRAARDISKLKVGIAFGAGSEKGYAHIGVLRVLRSAGVPVDYCAGTSVGAGMATGVAMGFSNELMLSTLDALGSSAFRISVPVGSILSSEGVKNRLKIVCGDMRFENTDIPLSIVAADISSGREIVFNRGPIWPALLASLSIPGIYPPVRIGPYTLVDGGVLNPVPGTTVGEMGADIVISINLSGHYNPSPKEASSAIPLGKGPGMIQMLMRSVEVMQSKIFAMSAKSATIVIQPEFPVNARLGLRRFKEGRRYIEVGERAAREALPQMATALPWLR